MDAEVLSRAPDPTPLPDDLRVSLEASSPALPAGALPSDPPTSVDWSPAQALRLSIVTSLFPGAELRIFVLLQTLIFC